MTKKVKSSNTLAFADVSNTTLIKLLPSHQVRTSVSPADRSYAEQAEDYLIDMVKDAIAAQNAFREAHGKSKQTRKPLLKEQLKAFKRVGEAVGELAGVYDEIHLAEDSNYALKLARAASTTIIGQLKAR